MFSTRLKLFFLYSHDKSLFGLQVQKKETQSLKVFFLICCYWKTCILTIYLQILVVFLETFKSFGYETRLEEVGHQEVNKPQSLSSLSLVCPFSFPSVLKAFVRCSPFQEQSCVPMLSLLKTDHQQSKSFRSKLSVRYQASDWRKVNDLNMIWRCIKCI